MCCGELCAVDEAQISRDCSADARMAVVCSTRSQPVGGLMSPKKETRKPAKGGVATGKKNEVFTEEERAAMREYVREKRAAARGDQANGENEVLEKIAQMPEPDRAMATRLHALMKDVAPDLSPK